MHSYLFIGFFFAHMGWLFIKKHPAIVEAGKKLSYDDLANDSCVTFQKKLDPWFALFMCFVFPGLVCTLWGDNFWNGYWVAGGLR
jgi:stearoyl-CoA desaturase (delta-9 desaturase)